MDFIFPETVGNFTIPIDELIFFTGVGILPTSHDLYIIDFPTKYCDFFHYNVSLPEGK